MEDITSYLWIILGSLWLFIPAMLPNSAAVIFGGGMPVDFGKSMGGRRILGDGKTWRGFIGGGLAGVAVGLVQMCVAFPFDPAELWGFGPFFSALSILFLLAFGSLTGDIIGSLIKRRIGLERGAKAPILDQYDFLFGAFLLLALFRWDWFYYTYVHDIQILGLISLLILIPLFHRLVNIIAYRLGLKDKPW